MTFPALDTIYPAKTFLAPRREDEGPSWAPLERHMTELMTANLLACAGGYPMLVQKGAMSPPGLAAMERCGVAIGSAVEVYETSADYDRAIGRRLREGEKAAFVYPPETVGSGREPALVDADGLRFLNDKANVPALAGPDNVPARRRVDLRDPADRRSLTMPVVLKVASRNPSVGGLDVAICRNGRQLERALARFAGAETAFAETFVEAARNWCIQFAVMPDGQVREMGASEQICLRNGVHAGNLLCTGTTPPVEAVSLGRAIAEAGGRRGFRGVCGFDILIDRRGKPYAIDLNFRPVSSTAFVVEVTRRMERGRGETIARLAFLKFDGQLPRMLDLCEDGFRDGWLVPLATFDPEYGGLESGPARVRAAIFAEDRGSLHRREALLASRGMDFVPTPTRWDAVRARLRALI